MMPDPEDELNSVKKAWEELLGLLDMLPGFAREKIEAEIRQLLAIVQEARVPRVMIFGRRGSGKSTLINAMFDAKVRDVSAVRPRTGKAEWMTCEFGGRRMQILDTRGVQEGSKPAEFDDAATSEESLMQQIRQVCPDVILLTVKACDVDSAIHGDLGALQMVRAEAARVHGFAPTIIPVVTQCDQLDPVYVPLPTDNPTKLANIATAVEVLAQHLSKEPDLAGGVLATPVPIVALKYFGESDGDLRWNMDALALAMQEHLPDQAQLAFTRLTRLRPVQKKFAQRIVNIFTTISGVVGANPLPFADMPVITGLQSMMILCVSYISGRSVTVDAVRDFLVGLGVNVGAGMVFREIARGLLKAFPGLGDLASGGIAASGTKVIGAAAIEFYIDRRSLDEVRKGFRSFWDRFTE